MNVCKKEICRCQKDKMPLSRNPINFPYPPYSRIDTRMWSDHCKYDRDNIGTKPCPSYDFVYDFRREFNSEDFDLVFGDDGTVTQDSTGLTVDSVPFTQTIPVGNEHAKWLKLNEFVFPLCDKREVVFETEMAVQQVIDPETIPEEMRSRIRNVDDDIRLAAGAFNVVDPNTWMVFDFLISNKSIYILYERLPFGQGTPELGNYASFTNAVWVARRAGVDPLNEFNKLAIGINKSTGVVTWYVDDRAVFTWDKIGYKLNQEYWLLDHGGDEGIVEMNTARIGFGTFSILDAALPNNYGRDYVETIVRDGETHREIASSALVQLDVYESYKELYPDPLSGDDRPLVDTSVTFAYPLNATPDNNREVKLFGQGSRIKVKYIRVHTNSRRNKC